MKLTYLIFINTFFFLNISFSQNERDLFIKDSILPILNTNQIFNKVNYELTKKRILVLEEKYNYETDLKIKILESSFYHRDLFFFRKTLKELIKNHGFQISSLEGNENYYNTIINGDLSKWFKKIYIKNHSFWLEKNFNKVNDLKKLNEIYLIDKTIAKLSSQLMNRMNIDSSQKEILLEVTKENYFENIITLHDIAKKYDKLPNSKNFSILKNCYENTIIHNLRENTDKTWELLYPYYKKAYINYEISNTIFQNYDFYCYLKHGYQEFNSFKIEQIPLNFRKNNDSIPLKDENQYNKIKNEFRWF